MASESYNVYTNSPPGAIMDSYFVHLASTLEGVRTGNPPKRSMVQELKSWDLWRAVLAESLATMLFVFIGTMSALSMTTDVGNAKFVRIAFAFGIMIAVCIQMIGHVSGGHINPAVSVAMALTLNISPLRAALYVIGQCVGGMFGSLILKGVSPDVFHSNLALTQPGANISAGQALGCEIIFTFILVLSIYGCTDSNRAFFGSPALGIGLTVAVCHLAGIPFSGASMNPARSLGSAVVSEDFDYHWVYWVGPLIGGPVAGLAYKFVFNPYKGNLSFTEAADKMMEGPDVIVVPKSYLKAEGNAFEKGNVNSSFQKDTPNL